MQYVAKVTKFVGSWQDLSIRHFDYFPLNLTPFLQTISFYYLRNQVVPSVYTLRLNKSVFNWNLKQNK
jgi:hypothetical protein